MCFLCLCTRFQIERLSTSRVFLVANWMKVVLIKSNFLIIFLLKSEHRKNRQKPENKTTKFTNQRFSAKSICFFFVVIQIWIIVQTRNFHQIAITKRYNKYTDYFDFFCATYRIWSFRIFKGLFRNTSIDIIFFSKH